MDFDVQIGAFRNPDPTSLKVPASVGELRAMASSDGLTRFLVGPFASKSEAARARDELRSIGYKGAFIRATEDATGASTPIAAKPGSAPGKDIKNSDVVSPSKSDLELLSSLSYEERSNVVYLDGRLHKKVGETFVPLRD